MLGFLLLSCGMQKRQYMSGYYVSWKKNKAKTEASEVGNHSKAIEKQAAAGQETDLAIASAEREAIEPSRSKRPLISEPVKPERHENITTPDAQATGQSSEDPASITKEPRKTSAFHFPIQPKKLKEVGSYNGFAIASLVTGILALITYYGAFVFGILAIVFGAIALKRIRENGQKGRGMAIAGLICGIVALVAVLVVISVISAFAFA